MSEPVGFKDLTAEDFAPAVAAPTPAQQAKVMQAERAAQPPSGPSEAEMIEPSWLKRGLAGAGASFMNKWNGLTGEPVVTDFGLSKDTAGSVGGMLPDALGSMIAPARILPQMTYGALTRAVEPAPNVLERGVNAIKGAAEQGIGQGVASGLVRGVNRLSGNMTREGQAAAAARGQGLNLTVGDILDSKLMRLAEGKSFKAPGAFQADQVATLMNKDTGDPITNGVMTAYNAAQGKVSAASAALDQFVAQNSLPAVRPVETISALRDIMKHNPATLEAIDDVVLRDRLKVLSAKNPNKASLSFEDLDDLRKAVGPIMAKIKTQSTSGSNNVTTATANRWAGKDGLYAGIMKDIDAWGATAQLPKDAVDLHKTLSSTFKNEVLPLRDHPIAGKIVDNHYDRPEDLLRDLTSPRNRSIVKNLYGHLDEGGRNAFDALRLAERGSKEFVKGESAPAFSRPLVQTAIGAGGVLPWVPGSSAILPWIAAAVAAEQAAVHGANTTLGRAIASGSPQAAKSPLANAALYSAVRTGTQRGMDEVLP